MISPPRNLSAHHIFSSFWTNCRSQSLGNAPSRHVGRCHGWQSGTSVVWYAKCCSVSGWDNVWTLRSVQRIRADSELDWDIQEKQSERTRNDLTSPPKSTYTSHQSRNYIRVSVIDYIDFSSIIQGGPKNRIPSFIFWITSVIQHRF